MLKTKTPFLIHCICYTLDSHFVFMNQELKFTGLDVVSLKIGFVKWFSIYFFSVFDKYRNKPGFALLLLFFILLFFPSSSYSTVCHDSLYRKIFNSL